MTGRPAPSDTELVAASRRGDRDAFAQLFVRHRHLLTTLVARMLDDRAPPEDVVHEATVTALTSLDRLQDPARFGPWLSGIGLNLCRRWLHRRSGATWSWEALQGGLAWSGPLCDSIDPVEAVVEGELAERVRAAVADLPAGQRRAIVLFYFAGLTQREVTDALGVEVGAINAAAPGPRVPPSSARQHLEGLQHVGRSNPLSAFTGTDLSRLYVVFEVIFGNQQMTIQLRNIHYSTNDAPPPPSPTPTPTPTPRPLGDIYVGNLEPGLDIGIDTSGHRFGWLSADQGTLTLAYPDRQVFGAMFITVGTPVPPGNRPSVDLSG